MKDRAEKKGVTAPCEPETMTQSHVLYNQILQTGRNLSRKKGARDCNREEKSPLGTPKEKLKGILPEKRSLSREKRIAKRRADMPRVYRGIYDKAMTGKSLRAAVNAFCLECVMWQREEVRLCPSTPCPLWLYRPYREDTVKAEKSSGFSKTPHQGPDSAPESSNGLDR